MRQYAGRTDEFFHLACSNRSNHRLINLPDTEWQQPAALFLLGKLLFDSVVVAAPEIDIDVLWLAFADFEEGRPFGKLRIERAIHVREMIGMLRRLHAPTLVRTDLPNHVRHVSKRYEVMLAEPLH